MKEITANVKMYVGECHDGQGFTEMEYNPYEQTVIFRDHEGNEIWLDPESMEKTLNELATFVDLMKRMGVKTKGA